MKRLMTAVCMAGLIGATAVAQTMPNAKTDKDKMPKGKTGKAITVTGCVAAGIDANHFTMTDGVITGETMSKSYELMGSALKAHLAHKVAVTGTMETGMGDNDKMAAMPKSMEQEDMGEHKVAPDKMGTPASHGALRVTSVKMIAATCS